MAIFRIGRYTIHPEQIERCKAVIEEVVADITANEPGTVQYTVLQEEGNPTSFVHCSVYVDEAARERHLGNAMMLERFAAVLHPAMIAPPQFQEYTILFSKPGL